MGIGKELVEQAGNGIAAFCGGVGTAGMIVGVSRALKEAGCHQAQGYLFSRPLSVSAANAMANECPAATFASASLEARVLVR